MHLETPPDIEREIIEIKTPYEIQPIDWPDDYQVSEFNFKDIIYGAMHIPNKLADGIKDTLEVVKYLPENDSNDKDSEVSEESIDSNRSFSLSRSRNSETFTTSLNDTTTETSSSYSI